MCNGSGELAVPLDCLQKDVLKVAVELNWRAGWHLHL